MAGSCVIASAEKFMIWNIINQSAHKNVFIFQLGLGS